ncbi:MAG: flagellin [Chloroflexi bacterium]|nr:flagellin [Chloroflexota bacterium]
MGLRINTNLEALNAQRYLQVSGGSFAKSVERLSSGLRINRAGDDAAGLSISEKLRAQVNGFGQAIRNSQDGISLIQTAEGALNETHSILQRMRELLVQYSNDATLTSADRTAISNEITALQSEVDRIANKTTFNGTVLLAGTYGVSDAGTGTLTVADTGFVSVDLSGAAASTTYTLASTAVSGELEMDDGNGNVQRLTGITAPAAGATKVLNFDKLGVKITINSSYAVDGGDFNTQTIITSANAAKSLQVGPNQNETISLSMDSALAADLGVDAGSLTLGAAGITQVETAIATVSSQRGSLGALQNRLEHTIANQSVSKENLQASESRIRDVDMASEMVNFTRAQILQNAGMAILAQANSAPQSVLTLLR